MNKFEEICNAKPTMESLQTMEAKLAKYWEAARVMVDLGVKLSEVNKVLKFAFETEEISVRMGVSRERCESHRIASRWF